jgi:hypothetical protein
MTVIAKRIENERDGNVQSFLNSLWDDLISLEYTQWWVHGVHCKPQTKHKKGGRAGIISQ